MNPPFLLGSLVCFQRRRGLQNSNAPAHFKKLGHALVCFLGRLSLAEFLQYPKEGLFNNAPCHLPTQTSTRLLFKNHTILTIFYFSYNICDINVTPVTYFMTCEATGVTIFDINCPNSGLYFNDSNLF